MRVMFVWVSKNPIGRQNLAHGLSTGMWGFPRGKLVEPAELVVFGHDSDVGGPRVQQEQWERGHCDMEFAVLDGPLFEGTVPHWPDEVREGRVKYPTRFRMRPSHARQEFRWLPPVPWVGAAAGL